MDRYVKSLDGLRGFGIFFVLFYHYFGSHAQPWLGFSWIWVQMFFVQSGYLITNLLLADKASTFPDYAKRFYWRRAVRIFPPYVAYLAVFMLAYALFRKPGDFLIHLPYLATYTYNFTRLVPGFPENCYFVHLWSLAVEEQFYLIWPFVIFFFNRRQLRYVIVAFVFLAPIGRGILAAYLTRHHWFAGVPPIYGTFAVGEATYGFTLSQWDAFAYGAAIPLFNLAERIKRPGRWAVLMVGITLAAGLGNFLLMRWQGAAPEPTALGLALATTSNWQHVWSYSLVNFMFMFVILHVTRPTYHGLFAAFPFVRIGKIVYGLYIYHFAIVLIVRRVSWHYHVNQALSFVVSCVLSLLVAHVSYDYFEKKLLPLKDRWGKHWARMAYKPSDL